MQPVERLAATMTMAVKKAASDIYLFPRHQGYEVIIHTATGIEKMAELSIQQATQVIAYVKYQANMAISDHRRPQVGALSWSVGQQNLHLRLSTVGDFQDHESMVIRIIYPLSRVSHQVRQNRQWPAISALAKQRGLMVLSGPTGAGKTTTIYQLAKELGETAIVLAIEDPVEIAEPQFLQLQVNDLAGMSYDNLLKVALRHRPDVFIIGEIRDLQTAQVAIRAALSGHLVLTTIHAQSTFGVVTRLRQLGVNDLDLQQALTGVCYQRLVPGTTAPVTIYDWLTNHEVFDQPIINGGQGQQMSGRWHDALSQAVNAGEIIPAVAGQYAAG